MPAKFVRSVSLASEVTATINVKLEDGLRRLIMGEHAAFHPMDKHGHRLDRVPPELTAGAHSVQ